MPTYKLSALPTKSTLGASDKFLILDVTAGTDKAVLTTDLFAYLLTGANVFTNSLPITLGVANSVNGQILFKSDSSAFGAAISPGTLAADRAYTLPDANGTFSLRTAVETLTNKRITARVDTLTDAATVIPATDSFDGGKLTSLSQATQFLNPTGTPTAFQRYTLRIKSTTTRALTYDTQYRGSTDLPLPSATTGSSLTDYLLFQWNADVSKWDILSKNFGF